MGPAAPGSQVVSVRIKLKELPEVASCSYLDHAASYRKLKSLVAKHEVSSVIAAVLTPATTPPLFVCRIWTKDDVGLVEQRFRKATGVMAVYPATGIPPFSS